MARTARGAAIGLIISLCIILRASGLFAFDESQEDYDPTNAVIAYQFICASYLFNSPAFDPNIFIANPRGPLARLSNNILLLPKGETIPGGMLFVDRTFIAQNKLKNHLSGYAKIRKFGDEDNVLFVTTPIKSFGGRALVILSTEAPVETTIFSVGPKMDVELFYNTFLDGNYAKSKYHDFNMGLIYSVRTIRPGHFLLQEGWEASAYANVTNREFILDVTKGTLNISERKTNHKRNSCE